MALKYSVLCLAVVLVSLATAPVIRQSSAALMHGSLDFPPEVLAQKRREIAGAMGYTKKPFETNLWLDHRRLLVLFLRAKPEPRKWDEWLASEAPIKADYRESQSSLAADPFGYVTEANPPLTEPGMVFEEIDGHGLMRRFSAVPPDEESSTPPVEPGTVFRFAGLDLKNFTEVPPRIVPAHAADVLRAWKGPHPGIPDTELTVEIASWKGRITQVQVEFPWYGTGDQIGATRSLARRLRGFFLNAALAAAGLFGIFLALRNWKRERVDKRGALRIAIASFALGIITWAGLVHPIPSDRMLTLFGGIVGDSFLNAALLWMLYLALEPHVRARWPHAIVTWNRILAGRWTIRRWARIS